MEMREVASPRRVSRHRFVHKRDCVPRRGDDRILGLTAGNAELSHQHEQCDEIDRRIAIHATLLQPGR